MGKPVKKKANVNTKKRSAMELARVAAEKVKKAADKHKMKRPREAESEDELLSVKKKKDDREETDDDESGEEKSGVSDCSSETEIQTLESAAEVKDHNTVLDALHKNKQQLKLRIEAAKKKTNEAKMTELRETLNSYPDVRSVILYNWISLMLIAALSRTRSYRRRQRRRRLLSKQVPLPFSLKRERLL
jgi:outer membrane murein-binding lipoprotein Lpp